MADYQKISRMLKHFEVSQDGVLFVHSAFRQFSIDGYKPEPLLQALIDYCKDGTILLPTMSWRFVNQTQPIFNSANTPSNTGILTEIFRKREGVLRSVHPTHSVAGLGKNAFEILNSHHLSQTPCDMSSPFARLIDFDATILMLGVGMDCCTLVHHVEEVIEPSLYVTDDIDRVTYDCYSSDFGEHKIKLRRHKFLPRNYWQFQDMLAQLGLLRVHNLDNSVCMAFKARDLKICIEKVLKENPEAIIARPGIRFRMM